MRAGHRFATTLALPALVILPLAAAVRAQGPERTSDPTRLPFTGYVGRMIGSSEVGLSPEASQVMTQFFEFLNGECTAVAKADSTRDYRHDSYERSEGGLRGVELHRDLDRPVRWARLPELSDTKRSVGVG